MKNKAVFIHSLFRTGSTYLWSKFRRNPDFVCYYEPLHPALRSLSLERPFVWDSSLETTDLMHHPPLNENKHAEYQGLLRPGHDGVPFFKKSFSYDEYCENGENDGLKRYVDFLIENAGQKRAVFKFNRSSLRIRWFKKNYPTCLHLYLFRNPRDQWESYNSMSRNGLRDLFIATDILIASINQTSRQRLSTAIP